MLTRDRSRYIEECIENVKHPESRNLIRRLHQKRVSDGKSLNTQYYVVRYLSLLANYIYPKSLKDITPDECWEFLYKVKVERGEGAREQAVKAIKILGGFLGRDLNVSFGSRNEPEIVPLTEDEVQRLIDAARTLKYKTLISVGYEAACRPIELRMLRIRDVVFDAQGARITIRHPSRLKQNRTARLIFSVPLLRHGLRHIQ